MLSISHSTRGRHEQHCQQTCEGNQSGKDCRGFLHARRAFLGCAQRGAHAPEPSSRAAHAALRRQTTDEVRRIVQFANAEKIALVPFGGGSGLMGGAIPIRPSLAIDLRDLKQIVEIDIAARSARVQAGVVLEALDARLNELGYILGHDPWTVPVATIGGAISTNSVGYRAG